MPGARYLYIPFILVLFLASIALPSHSQESGLERAKSLNQQSSSPLWPIGTSELIVIRLYVKDRNHLNAVAGELDIWENHPEEKYAVAAVKLDEYRWLQSLGYQMVIDSDKKTVLGVEPSLDPRFHYFDDYYANANNLYVLDFLQDINVAYPQLTQLYDIGDAWMAGQPGEHGRDIWVLRVTNEDPVYGDIADKPAFFLLSTIHARDVSGPELAIRYIKYPYRGLQWRGLLWRGS